MKKLVFTRNLPVLKSHHYVYGDRMMEWARDDDPILDALAKFSYHTGIDDMTVEEMDVRNASGRMAARRYRVRIGTWEGVCPRFGLLSRGELFELFDNTRYFTVACNRKAAGLDVNTGEKPAERK